MPEPTTARCPICRRPVPTAAGPAPFHPFCSDRCKLIDLGRWLGGTYQIDVEDPPPSDADDDGD